MSRENGLWAARSVEEVAPPLSLERGRVGPLLLVVVPPGVPPLGPLAHPGPAGDDVDGQLLPLVLVGRLLPLETARIQRDDAAQEREGGPDRVEGLPVHWMNEDAQAELP